MIVAHRATTPGARLRIDCFTTFLLGCGRCRLTLALVSEVCRRSLASHLEPDQSEIELLVPSHGARDVALGVALGDRLATVLGLLAFGESQFDLRFAAGEVDLEWDHRVGLRARFVEPLIEFVSAREELAAPVGVVTTEPDGVEPRRHVHLIEPQFVVVETGVALGDLCLAFSERLHLRTHQHDAALEGFDDLVVVAGATIRGDRTVTTGGVNPLLGAPFLYLLRSSHRSSVVTGRGVRRRWVG